MERKIYAIYEDLLQSASEANCGRELTEIELKRAYTEMFENEHLFDGVYTGLVEVAEEVMNNEGGRWNETDEYNKNKTLDEVFKDIN